MLAVCDGGAVTLSGSGASTYAWDNSVTDGTAFSHQLQLELTQLLEQMEMVVLEQIK